MKVSLSTRIQSDIKMSSLIFLMFIVFLFSGCASIVSKNIYPLTISSNPDNAYVSITDKRGREIYSGHTPATVSLKAGAGYFSKAEYMVKFSSPGYDSKIVPITFTLDGWYFGNILVGGLLGMLIVDPATGAMWRIDIDFLNETLSKSVTSMVDPEMKILDIDKIPKEWKTHLVQVN